MARFRATANGFAQPADMTFARFIQRGETFEFSGVAASWMQPLDAEAQANTPPRPKRRSAMLHRTVEQLGEFKLLPGQKPASSKNEGAIEP